MIKPGTLCEIVQPPWPITDATFVLVGRYTTVIRLAGYNSLNMVYYLCDVMLPDTLGIYEAALRPIVPPPDQKIINESYNETLWDFGIIYHP